MRLRRFLDASLAAASAAALVSCHGTEALYSIGGSISGTTGTVVLRLNGANDITQNGDGNFTFTQKLLQNDTFNVQVANPTGRCTVQNGAGTVAQSNINNVNISCADYTAFPAGLLQVVIRSTKLSGAKVNPAVTTNATAVGGLIVTQDKDTSGNVLVFGGLVLSGLAQAPTDIAIFQAPKGNPGGNGLAIPNLHLFLAADGQTAILPPDAALTSNQLTSLFAGELYFNVSTPGNLNGEIRGAIELQGGVGASAQPLDNTQVVPPTTSTAFGDGVLMVDRATNKIVISYVLHTVVGALGAGINTNSGAGNQILGFANLQDNFDGNNTNLATPVAGAVLTQQDLSDFDNSHLFFNVTSATFPNGEIRGNISPLQ